METIGLLAVDYDVAVPAINFKRFTMIVNSELTTDIRLRQSLDALGTGEKDIPEAVLSASASGVYALSVDVGALDLAHPPGEQFDHISAYRTGAAGQVLIGLFGENPLLGPTRDIVPILGEGGE